MNRFVIMWNLWRANTSWWNICIALVVFVGTFCDAFRIGTNSEKIVLIVLDGFSKMYLENASHPTPNLKEIYQSGVLVEDVLSEFPALRLPHLTSLLTGVHSEDHNVLGEQVYDSASASWWGPEENADLFWKTAESLGASNLWMMNDGAGADRKSGVCGWPYVNKLLKSDDIWVRSYKENLSDVQNWQLCSNSAKEWLKNDSVNFVSIYVNEPGKSAEIFGPLSPEAFNASKKADEFVGNLRRSVLEQINDVNFIILTTPGFTSVNQNNFIDLSGYIQDKNQYVMSGSSPVVNIKPNENQELSVWESLRPGLITSHYDGYIKENMPNFWHYRNSPFAQPIVLIAKEGYVFSFDFFKRIRELDKAGNRYASLTNVYGCSGYDNRLPSMRTLLIASGPSFRTLGKIRLNKNDTNVERDYEFDVKVVDIYSMLCYLLNVQEPDSSKGEVSRMNKILVYPPGAALTKIKHAFDYAMHPENLPLSVGLTISIGCAFMAIMCCFAICSKRRKKNRMMSAIEKGQSGYRYTQVGRNRHRIKSTFPVHEDETLNEDDDNQMLLKEESEDSKMNGVGVVTTT